MNKRTRKPAICLNCGREKVLRSHGLCSGCGSIVDRVSPRKRKEALAAFKKRFSSPDPIKVFLGKLEEIALEKCKKKGLTIQDFMKVRELKEGLIKLLSEFLK